MNEHVQALVSNVKKLSVLERLFRKVNPQFTESTPAWLSINDMIKVGITTDEHLQEFIALVEEVKVENDQFNDEHKLVEMHETEWHTVESAIAILKSSN